MNEQRQRDDDDVKADIPIPLALLPAGNPDSWNIVFRIMGCIVIFVCLVVFKKSR